jgi:hypothetical protein
MERLMDILIEKTAELGVCEFRPVLTEFTQVRKLNFDRIETQIKEASEQSGQMHSRNGEVRQVAEGGQCVKIIDFFEYEFNFFYWANNHYATFNDYDCSKFEALRAPIQVSLKKF